MSSPIVIVENLGKKYRIDHMVEGGRRYTALRDVIAEKAKKLLGRTLNNRPPTSFAGPSTEDFWALRDVSFDVKQGEVLGIIGRNGAGKSTLLKVLSRITEPSTGRVRLRGRVASLLEVGTGFHPELTGRENIYLNGAILGMRKEEIRRKFDEIVAFAEVEKFLDTPVKRFSSGMYVRLAFAVAAHLEPEILIVDEVLAVGDAGFQEKCLGKMSDVAAGGRTILFVSHDMAAVQSLCTRVIVLDRGRVAADEDPQGATRHYLSDARTASSIDLDNWHDRITTREARITRLSIKDKYGRPATRVRLGGAVAVDLEVNFREPIRDPVFGLLVHNSLAEPILDLRSSHGQFRAGSLTGEVRVSLSVKELWLYPGSYLLSPWVNDASATTNLDYVKFCATLTVDPVTEDGTNLKLDPNHGKYWVPSAWVCHDVACGVAKSG